MGVGLGQSAGREEKDRVILEALASGATPKEAADLAHVSGKTVQRRLQSRLFTARLEALRAESREGITKAVQGGATKAVATLVELLDSPDDSVRLGAARTLLQWTLRLSETTGLAELIDEPEPDLQHGRGG